MLDQLKRLKLNFMRHVSPAIVGAYFLLPGQRWKKWYLTGVHKRGHLRLHECPWRWPVAILEFSIKQSGVSADDIVAITRLDQISDDNLFSWNLRTRAQVWLNSLETSELGVPDEKKKITLLAVYRSAIALNTGLAIVLAKRGHDVTVLVAARASLDGGPPREPWEMALMVNNLKGLEGVRSSNIRFVVIDDVVGEQNLSDSVLAGIAEQSFRDAQTYLMNPNINIDQEGDAADFYAYRHKENLSFAHKFVSYANGASMDHWIIDSGSWAEYGVAYHILKEKGCRVVCPAFRIERGRVVISVDSPLTEMDMDNAWRERVESELTDSERRIAEDHAARSERPEFYQKDSYLPLHMHGPLAGQELKERLNIDNGRPIVLMMLSVSWDSTLLVEKTHHVFSSHRDWLVKTVDFFIDRADVNLIIRPHPADRVFGVGESTHKVIEEAFGDLPEHICLLPVDTDINTYGLMYASDFGVVYSSDVGWEMVMREKQVVAGGRGPSFGKSICCDSDTPAEYFATLTSFLEGRLDMAASQEQTENAKKFCYMYMKEIQKPFPWLPWHFWENERRNPLQDFLQGKQDTDFGDAISVLAGERETYTGMIGRR